MSTASSAIRTESAAVAGARAKSALALMMAGAALIFVVGFAPTAELHNAAHDTRHSAAFPCH